LVEVFGARYSAGLGIDLCKCYSGEIHKWFLAATLFGARISEALAVRTYRELEKSGVVTPERILNTGWEGLVAILDRGGYVRYDFKTATKLLEVNQALLDGYRGNLNELHAMAADPRDLEGMLKRLGKGIGDVTVNIFLRELRWVWAKAHPVPSQLVVAAAADLGLQAADIVDRNRLLQHLVDRWVEQGNRLHDFADFEAALLRYGLVLRRKTSRKTLRRP
jgi:hypothetical protein